MKTLVRAEITALLAAMILASAAGCAAEPREETSIKDLTLPAMISPIGLESELGNRMSELDVANAAAAKETLVGFFRALENAQTEPGTFLTPEFLAERPDRRAMANGLIPPESSVLTLALTDVEPMGSESVRLRYYAVVLTDGELQLGEGTADFRKVGSDWRISGIQVSR